MTTLASKVNQKLYHAELLLALQAPLSEPALKEKNAALEGSVAATLQAAFDLFVQELGEAVQVFDASLSLSALAEKLSKEERGLPAVDSLLVLQKQTSSWVNQIYRAHQQFVDAEIYVPLHRATAIQAVNLDDVIDLSVSLSVFKIFVSDNRAFFAEW